MPKPSTHRPWSSLRRAQRRLDFIGTKNLIRQQAPWLGGLFSTRDVLLGAACADAFLASTSKKPRIYNATLHGAMARYFSRCDELAIEASLARLPLAPISTRREWSDEFGMWLCCWEEASPEQIQDEKRSFGGLDRQQWHRQESDRLADSGDVWISPGWTLDFDYDLGVGLLATLPCELLTIPDAHAFALDFFSRGEPDSFESPARLAWPSRERARVEAACCGRLDPAEWAPRFGLTVSERRQLEASAPIASGSIANALIRL